MPEQDVTADAKAVSHSKMSRQDVRQDVSADIQSRKSEQKVTAASEQPFIAKFRKKMSQQDATEGCQGKMRQRCATARGHSRMSQ